VLSWVVVRLLGIVPEFAMGVGIAGVQDKILNTNKYTEASVIFRPKLKNVWRQERLRNRTI
jgi:hypothetical protein